MADLLRPIAPGDADACAATLIDRFGSLAAVLAAAPRAQRDVLGPHRAVLRQLDLLRRAELQMKRRPLAERDLLSTWPAVADYLRARLGSLLHEEVRVLFLDGRHHLLRESCVARGESDHVDLPTREIVARALSVEASGLILAHNHPSACTEPSEDDVRATRTLAGVVQGLGITLHDHLIVTESGWLSFRQRGLL